MTATINHSAESESFLVHADLTAMHQQHPIRFVHHKNMDRPENHTLHINGCMELYIYVSGNHRYVVGNSMYDLKRGDLILIHPREVHKALPLSESMYERFYFLIDLHAFDGMFLNPLTPLLPAPEDMGSLISPPDEVREAILSCLYSISDCFRNGNNDQLRAFSLFLQILDEITRCRARESLISPQNARIPDLLKQVLSYVSENVSAIQSVSEIAAHVGVSPQYLSGFFHRHIGTSLKIYVQAKKIALAKELLDKGANVTQACYECGFNDCSYFIRIFKKYVGVTPFSYKSGISSN